MNMRNLQKQSIVARKSIKTHGMSQFLIFAIIVFSSSSTFAQILKKNDPSRPSSGLQVVEPRISVTVGEAIEVVDGWKENTTVAFGPGEHPAAPDGRIIFAHNKYVLPTDLSGNPVATPNVWRAPLDANVTTTINDNHIVKLNNGDVLYTFEGVSWDYSDPDIEMPEWANITVEYTAKGRNQPGGRAVIYIYRSSDAGLTWTKLDEIDAINFRAPDVSGQNLSEAGVYSRPRRPRCINSSKVEVECCKDTSTGDTIKCKASDKKVVAVAGMDGHYTYVDPYSDRVFIATEWKYGDIDAAFTEKASFFLFVSEDNGESWQIISHRGDRGGWRRPISSLPNGKMAMAMTEGQDLLLTYFDRDTDWVDLSNPKKVATIPSGTPDPDAILGKKMYGLWWSYSLSRTKAGFGGAQGFKVSTPYWAPQLAHRQYFASPNGVVQSLGPAYRAIEPEGDTLQPTYIEPLPNDDVSLLYWFDRLPDTTVGERYVVRYQVFDGINALLVEPGILSIRNGQPYDWPAKIDKSPGSYMVGAVYRSHKPRFQEANPVKPLVRVEETVRKFVAPWIEGGKLVYNTITVRLRTKGDNRAVKQFVDADPRPRRVIPTLRTTNSEAWPVHEDVLQQK